LEGGPPTFIAGGCCGSATYAVWMMNPDVKVEVCVLLEDFFICFLSLHLFPFE
jgi:hypothetical protein